VVSLEGTGCGERDGVRGSGEGRGGERGRMAVGEHDDQVFFMRMRNRITTQPHSCATAQPHSCATAQPHSLTVVK